jgi:hypothetical protein
MRSGVSEFFLSKPFRFAGEHLTPRAPQTSYLWVVRQSWRTNRRIKLMTFFDDENLSNFLHAALALPFIIPLFGIAMRIASHLI